MNVQLCLGLASLLFVFGHAVEPPDQNPGKFGSHYEGDILVTNASGVKSGDRAFIGNEKWLWPDGNVYYRLASSIKADHSRTSMITEAMADITREAPCVNFIDVEEAGLNIFSFVDIVTHGDMKLEVSGLGCHSEVGYQGRRQILNLQPEDCFNSATIKHELFHTLGCVHEHSRPDVAEALEIFVNNIKPNLRSNFRVEKYDYDDVDKGVYTFNTPYDVMSIMQYPSNAFAFNDSLKTMQAKDPAFQDSFGYSDDFSVIDIVELNARYNCTMTTGLVFEYVNSYMDIMLSRRRMDQSAIAQLKEQHEVDQNRTKELEDQIVKLESQSIIHQDEAAKMEEKIEKLENQSKIDKDKLKEKLDKLEGQSKIDKNAITKLENEIKIDQDRRINKLENLISKALKDCGDGIDTVFVRGRFVEVRYEGSWTMIQRRGQYGNAAGMFYQPWSQYEDGFGSLDNEFWLGLKNIADITREGQWQLQVDLTDWDGKQYIARYNTFNVGPSPKYQLNVQAFDASSTLGDSLADHHGSSFTTLDNDQDNTKGNCAETQKGGWWYNNCCISNLNGFNYAQQRGFGISWYYGGTRGNSYQTWQVSVMKIRKINI